MDYEKAYTVALLRAKQAIIDCGHNEGRKRIIEDIFPELAGPDRIRQELIQYLKDYPNLPNGKYSRSDFLNWLEKQGEREWNTNEKDKITNLKTFIAKCKGFNRENIQKALDMIDSLKPQLHWKANVEQLTAFAIHLQKRGAFRDDLCMDFEHEAQSFIEFQKYNAKQKEL